MLDYKDILNKRYVLQLSLREIAEQTGAGKSGVHDFLKAFEKAKIWTSHSLPESRTPGLP